MIWDIDDRGIGLIDIELKLKALNAEWLPRLLETKHVINDFVNGFFKELNIDIRYISITSETSIKNSILLKKIPNSTRESFNMCKTRPKFKTFEATYLV